jgi:tetratricopeptide (TPR) repeat protein
MLALILVGMLLLPQCARAVAQTAMAHLSRGVELMRSERYLEAAKEFEQARAQDPNLEEARLNLAICDFELREDTRARRLFSALLSSRTQKRVATYYLGRINLLEDDVDRAILRFRSLEHGAEVRDEKYYLAIALFRKGQYSESADLLKQWIAEDPRDFRAHQRLARVLLKLGRPKRPARSSREQKN